MVNTQKEYKFLKAQLQMIKQRDILLEKIENNLYKMREIAEQVAENVPSSISEIEKHQLNKRFLQLKEEIVELEVQLTINYNK